MNPSTCGADGRSVVRGATLFVPACSLGAALLDAVDAPSGDPSLLAPPSFSHHGRPLETVLERHTAQVEQKGKHYTVRLLMSWCAPSGRSHQAPKTNISPGLATASNGPVAFSYDRASLQLTSRKVRVYVTCDRALHRQERNPVASPRKNPTR